MRRISLFSCLVVAFALSLGDSILLRADADRVYFGTYTRGDSKGIYLSEWDAESGKLSAPELAGEVENPSFLELSRDGRYLYAVSEIGNFKGGGAINAFRILEGGKLEMINRQPTGGGAPCHLSLSPDGKTLAVANYTGGNVASFRILEDGSLSAPVSIRQHEGSSVDPKRQKGPHAHSINFSIDGRFAYAADLGTDRIYQYEVDSATGELKVSVETAVAPGSGPRHFAFRPDGSFGYVIHELTRQVEVFSVDTSSGVLTSLQSLSTLPVDAEPVGSTAEVVAHPTGKFLYGSNRGHDSIVVYQIDEDSGTLTYVENEAIQGEVPRNFALSPDGKWLLAAGQKSNSVAVFRVDPETGALAFSEETIKVQSPVCIRFSPAVR